MLHTIRLQQRWQELKDRESAAQHHNQELMQKFDRAQDTLKEMMAATAAMKSIRMEYDQFLVESYPCRQKQQKKKSQVHHKTMMAEYMKMCLKREEEYGSTSSVKKALYSHNHGRDPQKDAVAQAYNGQGGSYPSFMDSPSHSQSDQTMATSVVPSTLLPCPQGFQLQHLVSTPPQNAPGWALDQADGPRSSVGDAETSSFSRRMSVHLSQELDFKPVRLSSEHVENRGDNTSSSSSSSVCGQMKCDRKKSNTSEKNRRSSQKSSKTSSSVGAKTSESEASSHKGSTSSKMRRNITTLVAGLPMRNHNETRERESPKSRSISETQSEHEVSQSLLNQSDSNRGNSPSRSEESSSGSDTTGGKKDNEGLEEDKEADSKSDEIEESDVEGDSEDEEASPEDERENESDKDRGSDDVSDKLKKQNKEQDSALLQDEEEHDDQSEDESDEEEQAEERDSDDVIISHQQNKPRVHFTLQEASEDDDGNEGATTATSDEDSSDPADDDIENLLAPHPQTKTREEKDTKTVEPDSTTPKVICNVEIFRGETHTDQQSDSDEFDHFYD